MSEFTTTQLTTANRVCLRLREAREATGLSLDDLVKKTKLQRQYIEALETCEFHRLPPGDLYHKQFIKAYVKALGGNPTSFVFQYGSEETKAPGHHHPVMTKRSHFHNLPAYIRFASLLFIALGMIGYLGWQIKYLVEPPEMVLHNPPDGFVTSDSALIVQGETSKEVLVNINGKAVPNNGNGQFQERLDLSPGVNTITVSAKRKYGKSTTITRQVVLKEPSRLTAERVLDSTTLP